MSLDIDSPRDMLVLRLHELCSVSYLSTRRRTYLAKLMFTLVQNNRYRKLVARNTRTNDIYK